LNSIRAVALPHRIKELVDAGANVSQADRYGDTPLTRAVCTPGAESVVGLLVRSGANVNARDWRGKTILDIAEDRGSSLECRQILIDAGAQRSNGSAQPSATTRAS
jgi:ankyrin repeat protein